MTQGGHPFAALVPRSLWLRVVDFLPDELAGHYPVYLCKIVRWPDRVTLGRMLDRSSCGIPDKEIAL